MITSSLILYIRQVRFRQIQKKYGLEVNVASRPGKRKTRAADAEDDEECEDDDDTDESPSKKRSNGLRVSQSRPARKKAVVQKELDSEDDAPVSTANRALVSKPDMPVKQGHYEQQVKDKDDLDIKQESPVHQVQMMRPSPTHPDGPPNHYQHPQQQQHRGHERLSLAGSTSGIGNMEDAQRSGVGMFRGMPTFHGASSMANSHQSQVLTPQQQAYLQNLQRLHHERVAQQDLYMGYGHGEPQFRPSAYMAQQAGGQYGQHGVSPAYTKVPQACFDPQVQGSGVQPLAKPPSRVPTRAQTQSPAMLRADNPVHSSGNGSITSAPESPLHPLFDERVQMPDPGASPARQSTDLINSDGTSISPRTSTK